jgi:hypothetical protein
MTDEEEKILREFSEKLNKFYEDFPDDFSKFYWDNIYNLYE